MEPHATRHNGSKYTVPHVSVKSVEKRGATRRHCLADVAKALEYHEHVTVATRSYSKLKLYNLCRVAKGSTFPGRTM